MSASHLQKANPAVRYSVILLLEEESMDFAEFIQTLLEIFLERGEPFEILVVAIGTVKVARRELERVRDSEGRIRALAMPPGTTQAIALKAALEETSGDILVVCGSYAQITRNSYSQLLDALDAGTDIVAPWRRDRLDPWLNRLQSRLFNAVVGMLTGMKFKDLSCTVKVLRRQVLEETELYGNMYRFLPVAAARKGFRTREIPCGHLQERGQVGWYGFGQYASRLLDILTIFFNTRFTRKPLRFFSIVGTVFLVLAAAIAAYVFFQKVFFGYPIGGRSVLLLALLFAILGVQTAGFGLLGEIIAFTHGRQKPEYTVDKII